MELGTIAEPRFSWIIKQHRTGPLQPFDVDLADHATAAVIPSAGSLVANWLLIVPRVQFMCLADAPREIRSAVMSIGWEESLARCGSGDGRYYFEHGARQAGSLFGCGVDQAHLHVVPLNFDLLHAATHSDATWQWQEVGDIRDPWAEIPTGREYLLVSNFERTFFATPLGKVSQFFRKLIARELGSPTMWDYRKYGCEQNAELTIGYRRRC